MGNLLKMLALSTILIWWKLWHMELKQNIAKEIANAITFDQIDDISLRREYNTHHYYNAINVDFTINTQQLLENSKLDIQKFMNKNNITTIKDVFFFMNKMKYESISEKNIKKNTNYSWMIQTPIETFLSLKWDCDDVQWLCRVMLENLWYTVKNITIFPDNNEHSVGHMILGIEYDTNNKNLHDSLLLVSNKTNEWCIMNINGNNYVCVWISEQWMWFENLKEYQWRLVTDYF